MGSIGTTLATTYAPDREITAAEMRRRLPWQGVGTDVEGQNLTASEAFSRAALLGWDLHKAPSFEGNSDDGFRPVPHTHHIVRPSDRKVFGTVGDVFTIHQPEQTAAWVEDLADVGSIINLGMANGTLFVILRTKLDQVGPDGSTLEAYLSVTDRFDGGAGLRAALLVYRKVCLNGMHGIISGNGVNLRHTANIELRKRQAGEVLGVAQHAATRAALRAERMANTPVQFDSWIDKLIPMPEDAGRGQTMAATRRDTIAAIYYNAPDQQDIMGSAWGAYNAVTAYVDHFQSRRATNGATSSENRLASALSASATGLPERALTLLGV